MGIALIDSVVGHIHVLITSDGSGKIYGTCHNAC